MRIKQLLIAVGIGTMLAACSSKDDYGMTNDDTIKLCATVATPAIGTRVAANDPGIISNIMPEDGRIRVRFYISGQATDLIGGTNNETDHYYIIGSDNHSLTAEGEEPKWGDNALDILAFYPDTYFDDGPSGGAELFFVETDQTITDNYIKSDLLWAEVTGATKTGGPLTLPFKHALSKIIVKLESGESGVDVSKAQNIQIFAIYGFTIDSRVTHHLSTTRAPFTNYIKLGNYNSYGVAGIIPPQDLPMSADEKLDAFITFEIDGVKYQFDPTITFKNGYQYTFTLTIDNSTVRAKSISLSPWTTDEEECNQTGKATI